jgi:hypothetical protein
MSLSYEIIGNVVVKNRTSGRQDYVCHLGDNISVGIDQSDGQLIAHGDITNVARIIQTAENYAQNASSDAGISVDLTIVSFPATEETVLALNNAVNGVENIDALFDTAYRDSLAFR